MLTRAPRFPETIDEVTEQRRVTETFGLGPSLVAVGLVWYGVTLASGARAALGGGELAILGLLFAGAAACVVYEIRRRDRRLVLVAGEGGVGLYRQGVLISTLTSSGFSGSRSDEPQSPKALLLLVAMTVLFIGYGLTETGGALARIAALGPGAYVAVLTISIVRGLWLCERFRFHGSGAAVLFTRAELRRAGVTTVSLREGRGRGD